jgi:AhpD family alkylhydroperoxidase
MQIPAERLSFAEHARRQSAAMLRFQQSIELARGLTDLIALRASQINGCTFCLDMHRKDMRAAGESDARIVSVAVWRESPLYAERERAALELCEAMTLVADTHVPDAVWERARASFADDELAQVLFAIAAIDVNIAMRLQPGHYSLGRSGSPPLEALNDGCRRALRFS